MDIGGVDLMLVGEVFVGGKLVDVVYVFIDAWGALKALYGGYELLAFVDCEIMPM